MAKGVAERYRMLDEVEHVLARPGMYLGPTKTVRTREYLLRDGKVVREEVDWNPGLLKIFDEIVTNSVDEHRRNPKLNEIEVTASSSSVTVRDNGGIPVVKHPDHGVMVPELIFSNLRAGSNFNDDEKRTGAGTHGLGSTLTNIYSLRFEVETADGKNRFHQEFTGNLSARSKARVSGSSKRFTQVTFEPDFRRFEVAGIDDVHLGLMRKRCADLAACNPGLRVSFNGEKFRFANFARYCEMYDTTAVHETSDRWSVAFGPSNDGHQQVSFANSAETRDGGTHVDHVVRQVVDGLRELIAKKHKVDVKPGEIRNHLFVFVAATVDNPAFSTQTKERLITEPKDFGGTHEVSQKLIKAVFASEAVQGILDWAQRKSEADERAELRKLAKGLGSSRVEKLVDAKGRDRGKCSLGVFEGMSALSAVRRYRDPQTFGAFPLKGKFINVSEMKPSEVMKNAEAADLMAALGLRPGEPPADLRYGKLLIYTDADTDGASIFCLLLNFIARFWPEMFDQGRVYRAVTPLAVARKGKETKILYTQDELAAWKGGKGWDLEYKKGLAALEDAEYEQIVNNPVLVRIDRDGKYKDSLEGWFGPDSNPRKAKLMPGIQRKERK